MFFMHASICDRAVYESLCANTCLNISEINSVCVCVCVCVRVCAHMPEREKETEKDITV